MDRTTLYVALDTSMLWNTYCMVRLCVVYRGRAVPLVWCVIEHGSAMVAYDVYKELLDKAATRLPWSCKVGFLADRGFADTELMSYLRRLGWHWRIRIKSNFWIYRCGHPDFQVGAVGLSPGHARFWCCVWLTAKRFGPVRSGSGSAFGK